MHSAARRPCFSAKTIRLTIFALCCVVALALAERKAAPGATPGLVVREAPDAVTLAWSGPIEKPMRDEIAAALSRFMSDPRRLVLTLNSPGGSLAEGHAVMAAFRDAAPQREIDTLVGNGSVCASMCVPVFLVGRHRAAFANAHFLFHEASLQTPQTPDGGALDPKARKILEGLATDLLYENDIDAPRVSARWLTEMRNKIVGRDVWISAAQLSDEGSGVIDTLF